MLPYDDMSVGEIPSYVLLINRSLKSNVKVIHILMEEQDAINDVLRRLQMLHDRQKLKDRAPPLIHAPVRLDPESGSPCRWLNFGTLMRLDDLMRQT